jgi:hypothetical protein
MGREEVKGEEEGGERKGEKRGRIGRTRGRRGR